MQLSHIDNFGIWVLFRIEVESRFRIRLVRLIGYDAELLDLSVRQVDSDMKWLVIVWDEKDNRLDVTFPARGKDDFVPLFSFDGMPVSILVIEQGGVGVD